MKHADLLDKADDALVAFLKQAAVDTGDIPKASIFSALSRGINEEDLTEYSNPPPFIFINAREAVPSIQYSGNWNVTVDIEVISAADKGLRAERVTRFAKVFNAIFIETLTEELSAVLADFTVQGVVIVGQGRRIEGRRWVSFFTLDLMECAGKDL
jgi:hypothetical protein